MNKVDYFELVQSDVVENPIDLMTLNSKEYCYAMQLEDFEKLERLKVTYFSGREYEEICDIVTTPTFMVTDNMKNVLEMYDASIEFKGVQIFPTTEISHQYPRYWIPFFQQIDCCHRNTEINELGKVDKLVLDRRKVQSYHIFRVANIPEYKVIVSLSVAESIMRRRFYGVDVKPVAVV